tara:strand:- start:243 stop:485 length:243 start_codon:yes stop_codon:yes gene_type:complete
MQTTIKSIIDTIFQEKGFNLILEIEQNIKKELGEFFLEKQVKNIFLNNKTVVIETNTAEAKAELNIFKTKIEKKTKIKIK